MKRPAAGQFCTGIGAAAGLARAYSDAAGYEHIEEWEDYTITGQMIDALAEIGLAAADVELIEDDGEDLERNLAAMRALIAALVTS